MGAQLFRFAIVGAAGFVVDASVLYVSLHFGTGYYVGRALSFLLAVWTTWQLNRRFTFSTRDRKNVWREGGKYLMAMSVGGVANYATYCLLIAMLPTHWFLPLLSVAVGSVAGLIVNFSIARHWVYKTSH